MKRHEALAPLSREHHNSLILAQLLKKGAPVYKGLPAGSDDKAGYALQQFNENIKKHFAEEEAILEKTKDCHGDVRRLTAEIIKEHEQLTALFLSLETAADIEDTMDRLGKTLENHIRKEERELFPLLQQYCSEALLKEIHLMLH